MTVVLMGKLSGSPSLKSIYESSSARSASSFCLYTSSCEGLTRVASLQCALAMSPGTCMRLMPVLTRPTTRPGFPSEGSLMCSLIAATAPITLPPLLSEASMSLLLALRVPRSFAVEGISSWCVLRGDLMLSDGRPDDDERPRHCKEELYDMLCYGKYQARGRSSDTNTETN